MANVAYSVKEKPTLNRNPVLSSVLSKWDRYVLPAIFLLMVLVFYSMDQRFLSPLNITNIMNQV